MTILHCIGIKIDDEKNPVQYNAPQQKKQQQRTHQKVDEVWKSEGIIFPWKANNVQNYFTFLKLHVIGSDEED